jgi:hypothetical protein
VPWRGGNVRTCLLLISFISVFSCFGPCLGLMMKSP